MLDCNKCDKKPTCQKLCKEVSKYVNQDYVHKVEPTYSEIDLDIDNVGITDNNYDLYAEMYGTSRNPKRLIYELHFLDKKDPKYITSCIEFGLQHIYDIIKKFKDGIYKEKGKRKQQILEFHLIEYKSAKYIADKLKINVFNVHHIISNYIDKSIRQMS
jgi:hypothetical protein